MPNSRFIIALTFAFAAIAPANAFAQTVPSPAPSASAAPKNAPSAIPGAAASATPAASPAPTPIPKLLQLAVFGDAAFSTVGGTDAVRFLSGAPSHIFDAGNGAFFDSNGGKLIAPANDFNTSPNLQNANVQLTIGGSGKFGGKIETSLGTDADFLASNGQQRNGINLTQAYAQYASGPVTFIAGKFSGLAGYELAETTSDTNFTRDYLYGAVMSTVTGARLTYAFNPKVSLIVGANNGWDDWKFVGKKKTLEGSLAIVPSPGYSLNLTTYNGSDFLANGNSALGVAPVLTNRSLYDAILTVHATSALTLVANFDSATQLGDSGLGIGSQRWAGIAGYANYQFSPKYGVSLRKETYRDAQGFRTGAGVPIRLQTNTATIDYTPNPNYIFRAEYRLDAADSNAFAFRHASNDPNAVGTGRPKQSEFALEMVVKAP